MFYKIIIPGIVFTLLIPSLFAQSGTFVGTPTLLRPDGKPITMEHASLTFQAPPKQHAFKIDDLISVHIKERTSYTNTADNQRRKKIDSGATLTGWAKFAGFFKMPLAAAAPLPEIGGTIDHKTQNRGRLTREETLDFYMACRITDIRDNGNLVIEGNRNFGIGEEGNIITVTGIVRPDAISRDFKVDSNQVADLVVRNVPSGNVYDTVRRPWGTRLFEQFKPF